MKYDIQTIENSLYKLLISITNDVSFDDFTIYGICKRGCCCHQLEVSEKGEKSFTVTIPALHRGIYNYQLFVKSISSNTEYLLLQGDVIINERIGDLQSEYKTVLPLAISDKITDVSVSITAAATLSDYEEFINGKYAHCKTVSEVLAVESNYKLDLTSKGQWLYDLTSLTNGRALFDGNINMTSFSGDLGNLNEAPHMFNACNNIISFDSDLSALTYGRTMFQNCNNLVSLNINNLDKLEVGEWMFNLCKSLISFEYELPELWTGHLMFKACKKLKKWNVDLPKLLTGQGMFAYCDNLQSFEADTPEMTTGVIMFSDCKNFTTFRGNLQSLVSGGSMFDGCKLDLLSVLNIAETINDLADDTPSTSFNYWGELTLGIQASLRDTPELETALATIRSKGWTVAEQYNQ